MSVLKLDTQAADGFVTLVLRGELDIASAPQVEDALSELEAGRPPVLVIDLRSLDFMDSTVGQKGNVLVGYADGCTGSCVTGGSNNRAALASIARQEAGTGLLSAFDTIAPPF